MLSDPLTLLKFQHPTEVVTVPISAALTRVRDIAPGKSVRVCDAFGGKTTLTISHSESKENKGIITDRSAVRLETRKTPDADGPDVVAQATLTVSSPRSTAFTSTQVREIVLALLGTLLIDNENDTVLNSAYLDRILAGEP